MVPLLLMWSLAAQAGDPAVVVSPSAETEALSRKDLRQLFTLRRRSWENGLPVRLVLPPRDSAEMTWLSDRVLGLPPDVYQRFLAEQAYRSGNTIPPRADASGVAAEMVAAGDAAGVLSVTSTPVTPPSVMVEVKVEVP